MLCMGLIKSKDAISVIYVAWIKLVMQDIYHVPSAYYSQSKSVYSQWLQRATFYSHLLFVVHYILLNVKVLVTTIDTQWEGMGDVGSARY